MPKRWTTLGRRDVYILPTRIGLYFTCILLFLFGVAVKYDNQAAYLMLFLLVSITIITLFTSNQNLKDSVFFIQTQAYSFVGQSIEIHLQMRFRSAKQGHQMQLYYNGKYANITDSQKGESEVSIYLPALTRGQQSAPILKLFSSYPLGLFVCWSKLLEVEHTCLVYPKPINVLREDYYQDNCATPDLHNLNAEMELEGIQAHKEGESLRNIHWPSYAKTHTLVNKHFIAIEEEDLSFNFDALPASLEYEKKLNQLCYWVTQAEEQKRSYQLVLPHLQLGPNQGTSFMHQCLSELACMPHE